MKLIGELKDKMILGKGGRSVKKPRLTARAIAKSQEGLYAVMYSDKFKLHSLPGGGWKMARTFSLPCIGKCMKKQAVLARR